MYTKGNMKIELNGKGCRPFSDVMFAIKPRAKEAKRYQLQYVISANNQLIGTDGKRVHIANNTGIADGAYEVLQENKQKIILYKIGELKKTADYYDILSDGTIIGLYPDISVWTPKHKDYFEAETMVNVLYGLNKKDIGVNIKYLADIIPDFAMKWKIFYGLVGQPIYFAGENREAFLMPLTLPEIEYKEAESEVTV